jgi:aryl-alcohol dehydrogenase-like predicted oxidoreductase
MSFVQAAKEYGLPRVASIQNVYSLLSRVDYETSLIEVCCKQHCDVGLMAYSPLAGGILTSKYAADPEGTKGRFNLFPGYMARYKQSSACEAVAKYSAVAAEAGMTPAELALAWCASRPHVTSTIIGATSVEQVPSPARPSCTGMHCALRITQRPLSIACSALRIAHCMFHRWSRPGGRRRAVGPVQLRQNIGAFEKEFTPEMNDKIEAIYRKYKDPAKNP